MELGGRDLSLLFTLWQRSNWWVTRISDPWNRQTLRGVRAPGTGIPFVLLLGTMRFRGGKDFTAIYKRKPADVYTFSAGEFKRWIVSAK